MVFAETLFLIGGSTCLSVTAGVSAIAGYLSGKFHSSEDNLTIEDLPATPETVDIYSAPRLYPRRMGNYERSRFLGS